MRYFLGLISGLLFFSSCTDENMMNLSGSVDGLRKGTIILEKYADTNFVAIDSIIVNGDSNFSFQDIISSPEMYYLHIEANGDQLKDETLPFFAEPGDITIHTSLDNLILDAKITGSANEALRKEYQKIINRYNNKNLDFIQESFNAKVAGNDSLAEVLTNKQRSNIGAKYLATVNFALNNNDTEVAPYLAISEIYDANLKYLDTIYKTLTPRIQSSKYGKSLAEFIQQRSKEE